MREERQQVKIRGGGKRETIRLKWKRHKNQKEEIAGGCGLMSEPKETFTCSHSRSPEPAANGLRVSIGWSQSWHLGCRGEETNKTKEIGKPRASPPA